MALYTLPVVNGDGSDGLNGWTVADIGWTVLNVDDDVELPSSGTPQFFYAGDNNPLSELYQDLVLPAERPAGDAIANMSWLSNSFSGSDFGSFKAICLDGSGAEIYRSFTAEYAPNQLWTTQKAKFPIPEGTETIRLVMVGRRTGGSNNNAYITDISDLVVEEAQVLPLVNPGAEDNLAGWTVVDAGWESSASEAGGDPHSGSRLFAGGGNNALALMYQDVTLKSSPVDAIAEISWFQGSYVNDDTAQVGLQFLDATDSPLGDTNYATLEAPTSWALRSLALPASEETVKIRVYLRAERFAGSYLNAYIDDVGAVVVRDNALLVARRVLKWVLLDGNYVHQPLPLKWAVRGFLQLRERLRWRIGAGLFPSGVYGAKAVPPSRSPVINVDAPTGSHQDALGTVEGSPIVPLEKVTFDPVDGGLSLFFVGDYYYRVWVVPKLLKLQNPRAGVPIEFGVWNAFPRENTLDSITKDGAAGLSLDLEAPSLFKAVEYRTSNITIDSDAPPSIDARFLFNFGPDFGQLDFEAIIADFIQVVPETPIRETWDWLTDILTSYGSREQRIALRATPRRRSTYKFLVQNDDERRAYYNSWYKSLSSRIVLPYYQYATALTEAAPSGSTRLSFDPDRTDMRGGEFAIVLDIQREAGYLVKFDAVDDEGATLDAPLVDSFKKGWVIAPAFTSRLADGSGLSMRSTVGTIEVKTQSLEMRQVFKRPGSRAAVKTYEGYPVLDYRPLANSDVPEAFKSNYEVIDNLTGVVNTKTAWPHPFVMGKRAFLVQRILDPVQMDWWRDFCDEVKGRHKPFLHSTWRRDIEVAAQPEAGRPQLVVNAPDYASQYFPFETYKRLQIETETDILWRTVLSVVQNEDGTQTLELSEPFVGENFIKTVSFLNKCRFNNDSVELQHDQMVTMVNVEIRTIDT